MDSANQEENVNDDNVPMCAPTTATYRYIANKRIITSQERREAEKKAQNKNREIEKSGTER